MPKLKINVCLIFIFIQIFFSTSAFAFQQKFHKELSKFAITKSQNFQPVMENLGLWKENQEMKDALLKTKSLSWWIQHGADWEDGMALSYFLDFQNYGPSSKRGALYSHFYNPLNDSGFTTSSGIVKGQSISERFNDSELDTDGHLINEWSYEMAKKLYYAALTGDASAFREQVSYMRSGTPYSWLVSGTNIEQNERDRYYAWTLQALGHTLHLIQDAAVPAHTRNDKHYLWEPLERWTVQIENIKYMVDNEFFTTEEGTDPWTYWKQFPNIPVPDVFIDTNQLDENSLSPITGPIQGLAEYSHANFMSHDTIAGFDLPATPSRNEWILDYTSGDYTLEPNKNGKNLTYVYLRNTFTEGVDHLMLAGVFHHRNIGTPWPSTSPDTRYTVKDRDVNIDYAKKLIPRAVGYSAGFLDYFFRGKLDIIPPSFSYDLDRSITGIQGLQVKNITSMDNALPVEPFGAGEFQIVYSYPWTDENNQETRLYHRVDTPVYTVTGEGDPINTGFVTLDVAFDKLEAIPAGIAQEAITLLLVYKGKIGNEEDGVMGQAFTGGVNYIVVKAGEYKATSFYTVWNPRTNDVAQIYNPDNDLITFPAEYEEIAPWLMSHSTTPAKQAYTWGMENNALKRIGESWQDIDQCTCTVDTNVETSCEDFQEADQPFDHPGCPDLQPSYCRYTQTVTEENGSDVWNTTSEGRVYVNQTFLESILGSYAPLVNTAAGTGEAACVRSEWRQNQTTHNYVPDGTLIPLNEWRMNQPITWHTPIGAMDLPSESYEGSEDSNAFFYCPSTFTWSKWHRDPPDNGNPIAKPIIHTNYSDKLMAQLYLVGNVQWSGTEIQIQVDGTRECQTDTFEESYTRDIQLVGAASYYPDGAANHDPRRQERNSGFENAVRDLVTHTAEAQQQNGEISEQDVFQGGISIYLTGGESSGPENGVLQLINEQRGLLGLAPLLPNNNLNSEAQHHAADMADNQFLAYESSNGTTMQERINATGYTNLIVLANNTGATEYIANGYETAEELFDAFYNSSSWNMIMNGPYLEVGVGSKVAENGSRYWCLACGFNDEH